MHYIKVNDLEGNEVAWIGATGSMVTHSLRAGFNDAQTARDACFQFDDEVGPYLYCSVENS